MITKSVLVTGCSSGIGLCVAHGLTERGYQVFATARKSDDVARLAAEGLQSVQLDLDSSQSIHAAVQKILQLSQSGLYGLVNNAGFELNGAVEDLSREALRAQFETNLFGTHELTRLLLPVMREQQQGRIIQISSALGLLAVPFRGAYCASKFALEALSDALRLELRNTGIHVAIIEPGRIMSAMPDNAKQALERYIDIDLSLHQHYYQTLLQRWQRSADRASSPEVVLKRVLHALESRSPKPRYYVGRTTHVGALLKRLLPYRIVDYLLAQRR